MAKGYMPIPPRHARALGMLIEQWKRDRLGAIGMGALREDDDTLTLEQIVQPLWDRGLIEDLTATEMGQPGKYFVRITPLGKVCFDVGHMPRDPRKPSDDELKSLSRGNQADERAAIQDEIVGTA